MCMHTRIQLVSMLMKPFVETNKKTKAKQSKNAVKSSENDRMANIFSFESNNKTEERKER